MNKTVFGLLICALVSTPLMAADKAPTTKKTPSSATGNGGSVDISNGTDVIGSQDAPLVLNVVSWKDKENYLPKNPLTASVLQEGLEPIDRDVVSREVGFSQALQQLPASTTTTP